MKLAEIACFSDIYNQDYSEHLAEKKLYRYKNIYISEEQNRTQNTSPVTIFIFLPIKNELSVFFSRPRTTAHSHFPCCTSAKKTDEL